MQSTASRKSCSGRLRRSQTQAADRPSAARMPEPDRAPLSMHRSRGHPYSHPGTARARRANSQHTNPRRCARPTEAPSFSLRLVPVQLHVTLSRFVRRTTTHADRSRPKSYPLGAFLILPIWNEFDVDVLLRDAHVPVYGIARLGSRTRPVLEYAEL